MKLPHQPNCVTRSRLIAFTLLEVMIAVAIFFMAAFAVLQLVSQNLRMARSLQTSTATASQLAAELSLTNALVEGVETGDFGELYPGLTWSREINLFSSNGLYQVDFLVARNGREDSRMSVLLFRPNSVSGAATGLRTRSGVGSR